MRIGPLDAAMFALDEDGAARTCARLPTGWSQRFAQIGAWQRNRSYSTPSPRRVRFRKGAWTQAVVKSARNEAPVYLYELDGQTPIDGGPEPQRLADTKSAAWLTFARTGDPSTPLLPWPTWHSDVGAGFRYREPGVNGFRDDERSCW